METISEIFEKYKNIKIKSYYDIRREYQELLSNCSSKEEKVALIEKEEKEQTERKENEVKKNILAHNFEVLFFKEVVPKVLEIYNQYEGKRVGEKTSDKIRNEVCQMLDTYPFSKRVSVSVYEKGISYNLLTGGYQTASFRYDTKSEKFFTFKDEKCKLNHLDVSVFCIPRKECVEDVDTFVKEKVSIAKEITDLSIKLETAIKRFNVNLPAGFRSADYKIDKYFYFRTK